MRARGTYTASYTTGDPSFTHRHISGAAGRYYVYGSEKCICLFSLVAYPSYRMLKIRHKGFCNCKYSPTYCIAFLQSCVDRLHHTTSQHSSHVLYFCISHPQCSDLYIRDSVLRASFALPIEV